MEMDLLSQAWGKLDRAGSGARLSLVGHSLDVAAVLEALLGQTLLRERLAVLAGRPTLSSLTCRRLGALAFLHDVGKASLGFQSKSLQADDQLRLLQRLRGRRAECGHTVVAAPFFSRDARNARYVALREALGVDRLFDWGQDGGDEAFTLWLAAISHHGNPITLGDLRHDLTWTWQPSPDDAYDPLHTIVELRQVLDVEFAEAFEAGEPLPGAAAFVHGFAGLVSLADWIGSRPTPDFFPYDLGAGLGRAPASRARARQTLQRMLLDAAAARKALLDHPKAFEDVFPFPPRPVQAHMARDDLGAVVIVESETGSGKTEAALWRFKALFEREEVDGLAFFLPTRVAATQIQERVQRFIDSVFPDPQSRPNVVLAVPGYRRADGEEAVEVLAGFEVLWPDSDDPDAAARRWAAEHAKRYFAAGCAVGTVDQLLLSGLRVSHSHLRASALLRSLVVVDEVHASDAYMTELLRGVLERHVAAGGYAVLLSATLGGATRDRLLAVRSGGRPTRKVPAPDHVDVPYPAISDARSITAVPSTAPAKTVHVELAPCAASAEEVAQRVAREARIGGRILVIRNTVRLARATQQALEAELSLEHPGWLRVEGQVVMHHGRYAAADRRRLDEAVERAYGKDCPARDCVLVGTQTLEISLDCDADLLVTDLAPMDVLLQRIGRLHRHEHERLAERNAARVVVLVPETRDLARQVRGGPYGFGDKRPYENVLAVEATWRALEACPQLEIPSQNRALVEAATDPARLEELARQLGQGWPDHYNELVGLRAARGGAAHAVALRWSTPWDQSGFVGGEERVRTRLGLDTRRVRLSRPAPSALGAVLEELPVPATLWPVGCDAEIAEVRVAEAAGLRFDIGDVSYVYDRLGLAREGD